MRIKQRIKARSIIIIIKLFDNAIADNNAEIFNIKCCYQNVKVCEIVYERVINVVTSAHWFRSKNYYIELHFLKALNRKIL